MNATRTVAVFGSSQTPENSDAWAEAELIGRELATAGLAVITGGYGGTMEAVSKGAAGAGGRVIGVIAPALFPDRRDANRYVDEVIEARDLIDRLGTLLGRADAVIVLPGSIGTATELMLAWNINYLARAGTVRDLPTVAVGDDWRRLRDLLVGKQRSGDIDFVTTPDEGVKWVLEALGIRKVERAT